MYWLTYQSRFILYVHVLYTIITVQIIINVRLDFFDIDVRTADTLIVNY